MPDRIIEEYSKRQLIESFVDLDAEIKEKDAEVKRLKKERALKEEAILEILAELGMSTFKTQAGKTVHLHRQTWANARLDENGNRDMKSACDALAQAGHPEMVETKFNVVRVSSLIRELERTTGIPGELHESLDVYERVGIRVRG